VTIGRQTGLYSKFQKRSVYAPLSATNLRAASRATLTPSSFPWMAAVTIAPSASSDTAGANLVASCPTDSSMSPCRNSPKRRLNPRANSVPGWAGSASSTAAFWKAQPRKPGDSNHSFSQCCEERKEGAPGSSSVPFHRGAKELRRTSLPVLQDGQDEVVLGTIVRVERRLGNFGFDDDAVDTDHPKPLLIEQPVGCLKDALPRFGGRGSILSHAEQYRQVCLCQPSAFSWPD
jgi:hypothetical protein